MKKSEAELKDYSTALPKLLQLGPEPRCSSVGGRELNSERTGA